MARSSNLKFGTLLVKKDIAKRIAEEVLRLDPQDSAPYVLLLNVQASAKRWQGVSEVRKVTRDRRVKKEPGISWFEVNNKVHQFCMGDKFHQQSMEIDMYFKELTWEMKLRGYVPDTGFVLHDTNAEEKEYNLAHHSEKLAIAFALMNTPEGVPIRVMKNLHVCVLFVCIMDKWWGEELRLATKERESNSSEIMAGLIIFLFCSFVFSVCLAQNVAQTSVEAAGSSSLPPLFGPMFYLNSSFPSILYNNDSNVAIVGGGNHSVVWSTNVGHPVKEGATLQLTVDGGLVLRNSDGDHVWSTNTLGKSVVGMNMTEWGNLVLFNNEGAIVWQSFDYPTNTLLVGQQLYEDQKLISRGKGQPQMYYQLVPDQTSTTSRGPYCAELQRGSDGHLKIFHHSNANRWREIVDMITHDLGECQHPRHCGECGLCRQGQCSCPVGIDWVRYFEQTESQNGKHQQQTKLQIPSMGCSRITSLSCPPPFDQKHYLVEVRNVSYFNLIDEDAAFPNISDIERWKEICLLNCSCGAVFFRYNNNVADGYCYIPSTVLTIREGQIPNHSFTSATFVQVQILWMLEDGTQIAAKLLDKLGQGMKEFFAEVETLGHIHHANLVRDESHVLATMRGTPRYIAPEWRQARVTIKADIYSFGIVLLEIVSGRRNFDSTQSESRKHLLQVLWEKTEYQLLTWWKTWMKESNNIMLRRR
ncbi:hypothetical protein ACSBR2_027302 [Camellia fascicularis]